MLDKSRESVTDVRRDVRLPKVERLRKRKSVGSLRFLDLAEDNRRNAERIRRSAVCDIIERQRRSEAIQP